MTEEDHKSLKNQRKVEAKNRNFRPKSFTNDTLNEILSELMNDIFLNPLKT